MALEKITLKLGKKKIELSPAEFEELKEDIHQLDKSYEWYGYPPYYYSPLAPLISTTEITCNPVSDITPPIKYTGSVLSYNNG